MSTIDPNKAKNSTSTAFITALVVNVVLLSVEVGTFLVLKQKLWRIYSPRTILPPPEKRAPELPSGPWKWVKVLLALPSEDIIHKNGLDAYMFMRYIRILMIIFSVFTFLTFAVIVPADTAFVASLKGGLDQISWSNITEPKDQVRFSAHVAVVYVLTFFVIWLLRREMLHFVHIRHQFLISKSHSRLAQARTVLISPIPDELASEKDLRTFASFVPGGIDRVWLYRDTKALNDLFEKREDACNKLEAATSSILKAATLAWRKKQRKYRHSHRRKVTDAEHHENGTLTVPPPSAEFFAELVPYETRPKHRSGFMGIFGPKHDTLDWCKDEIARLNNEIKDAREHIVKGKFLGSAFIRCNLQLGAHVLAQCLSYHEPLKMYNKWMEAHPKDIVWRNLDDGALEMKGRYVTSWLATIGLIIGWAIPVSGIGALSNLSELCENVHWLQWVCNAPQLARGLIEGVLPPLLLAILFAILPFILQALAWYECIPRYSLISVSVYRRFYFFLLIHGFLVVTLTSGITEAIEDIIARPAETVTSLSQQMPGASVFFLTYMVTQGLAGAGSALVQLVPLVLHFVRKWFLGRTPRQAYDVTFRMPFADFGTILPRFSLLATIAFAYSILSPLINLLALISFVMFYVAWKFLFSQVFDQPDERETGGMYFPMAVNNLFVGLYIEQVCLACLLFLKVDESGKSAVIQAVFMIILLVITALAQIMMHNSFSPMRKYLPMSLATQKMAMRFSRQKEGKVADNDEMDLFSRRHARSVRRRVKATSKRIENKLNQLKAEVKGEEGKKQDEKNTAESQGISTGLSSREVAELQQAVAQTAVSTAHEHPEEKSKDDKQKRDSPRSSVESTASQKSPMRPVFDEATPALQDDDDEEGDDDDHAFDHPSTYVDQAWIWIPKDTLGLSDYLANDLRAAGIGASDVGAIMDEKGVVEVTRNPPDQDWHGGHDL